MADATIYNWLLLLGQRAGSNPVSFTEGHRCIIVISYKERSTHSACTVNIYRVFFNRNDGSFYN